MKIQNELKLYDNNILSKCLRIIPKCLNMCIKPSNSYLKMYYNAVLHMLCFQNIETLITIIRAKVSFISDKKWINVFEIIEDASEAISRFKTWKICPLLYTSVYTSKSQF